MPAPRETVWERRNARPENGSEARTIARTVASRSLLIGIAAGGLVWAIGLSLVLAISPSEKVFMGTLDGLRRDLVMYNDEANAYAVWTEEGQSPLALVAVSPHIQERVIYCETSGWFEDGNGSDFDHRGFYRSGPSPRGLDRFPVAIDDGRIYADVARTLQGPARGAGAFGALEGPFCLERPG